MSDNEYPEWEAPDEELARLKKQNAIYKAALEKISNEPMSCFIGYGYVMSAKMQQARDALAEAEKVE